MENTTTNAVERKLSIATKHAFNMCYVLNDAQFDDSVSKEELIRKLREEFRKYTEANDRLFNEIAEEFDEG